MNTNRIDNNDFNYILDVLDKRSKNIRRNVFLLIYFIVTLGAIVAAVAYNINRTPNSPLANAISASIDSNQQKQLTELFERAALAARSSTANSQLNKENSNSGITNNANTDYSSNKNAYRDFTDSWLDWSSPTKSTSEKIAESISALAISFSVLMFVGFVMRVLLVFIRYYMQLGTDFENQKIAFLLSKGEKDDFSKNLSTLREHNISFEKTPVMPQEKMLDKFIELTKSLKGEGNAAK